MPCYKAENTSYLASPWARLPRKSREVKRHLSHATTKFDADFWALNHRTVDRTAKLAQVGDMESTGRDMKRAQDSEFASFHAHVDAAIDIASMSDSNVSLARCASLPIKGCLRRV